MSQKPPLRRAYDTVEKLVAPPLTAAVRSDEAANVLGLVTSTRRFVGRRVNGVTASAWHLANLPTRGDVQRLRRQIGDLDREVRRLTVQLELERDRREAADERS